MPIFGQTASNCDQIVDRERIERNAAGLCWREGLWTPSAAHGSSPPPLWDLGSCWHRGLCVLPLFLPSCQVSVVKIGRKCKKIKVKFAPKGPRIWRRHLWIHHFCKVCYSGKFAINLIPLKHAPQIFATLVLGHMMKRLGARNIFLLSSAIAFIFNTTFSVVDLVDSGTLFLGASVVLICFKLDICLNFQSFSIICH